MEIKSPLGKAKGLGSAHHGVQHWIMQRLTAVALIPLSVWFVYNIVHLAGADYGVAVSFFSSPLNSVLMAGIIIAAFWHANLGLQVVLEDYVANKTKRIVALVVIKLAFFGLGLASILSIINLHVN